MSVSDSKVQNLKEKDARSTPDESKYVPGVGHVPLKPKGRKKKNKSNVQGLGATGPSINLPDAPEIDHSILSPSALIKTNSDEPVALLDHAPAQNELPDNLVADTDELEDAIKQETRGIELKGKSPAEDMVAKRIRLLNKKIQRFRSYRDGTSLNTDQKAGLASLPVLEGNMKELEEIAKGLEGLAVEQTQNEKKVQEQHRKELETVRLNAIEDYKNACFPLLTALIQTYTTLHPSIPGMANFMAPELPFHLQDLSHEDVASLDGLYDKIALQGVESAIEELKRIKDERILQILNQKPAEDNDAPVLSPPKATTQELPAVESYAEESLSFSEQKVEDVGQSMDAFRYEPEIADLPAKQVVSVTPTTAESQKENEMSFMQLSELASVDKPIANETSSDEPDSGSSAELAAEETKDVEPKAKEPEVSEPETPNTLFSQPAILDWADDDEIHSGEDELAKIRAQFNMPPAAAASVVPALAAATASALPSQFIAPINPQGAQPGPQASQIKSQSLNQKHRQQHQQSQQQGFRANRAINGAAGNSGNWRRNGSAQSGENTPALGFSNLSNRGRGGHVQQHAGGRDGYGATRQEQPREQIEDDGFQVATKRRGPPPTQGVPTSGLRGRSNGGRGGGVNSRGRGGGDNGARGGYAARRDVNPTTA